VLAGSIPPPGDPALYVDLIAMAAERGGHTALDADGPVVEAVLDSPVRPTVLKLNKYELSRLMHRPVDTAEDALAAAREVRARGVESVAVTLGSEGAIAVTPEAEYRVTSPPVEIISAVGAGDAFLSGLMYGLVKEHDWLRALTLASAAGGAACLTPGTVLCHGRDVWQLRSQVKAECIREYSVAR
jgi:6-phosphofructokinase 2